MTSRAQHRAKALPGARRGSKQQLLQFTLVIEEANTVTIHPTIVTQIVADVGSRAVVARTAQGRAGDATMPDYAESTKAQRLYAGLPVDRITLRETGEMIGSIGRIKQKLIGAIKEGREVVSWDGLLVTLGVGAKAKGNREVTRFIPATKYLAPRRELQTVTVRNDIKRRALLLTRWADKNLWKGARDFLSTAQATKQAIAQAISRDAHVLQKVRVEKKRKREESRARRAARGVVK
jgi:hypothetical protein